MTSYIVGARTHFLTLCTLLIMATPAHGQPTAINHVSVAVGAANGTGGVFAERGMYTADVGFTRVVRRLTSPRVALRIGAHAGGTFRNGYDLVCRPHPNGNCAPVFPAMTFVSPVVGAELGDDAAGLGVHVGPSFVNGRLRSASFRRVGVESRVEGAARVAPHVGIVLGTRWTFVPDMGGTRAIVRTLHFGLRFF